MWRLKLLPSPLRYWPQMWQYILDPLWQDATCSSRTCLYMKDLGQPGYVHLNGPSFPVIVIPDAVWAVLLAIEDVDVESNGARCFLEMWPVSAGSEANGSASQPCQAHFSTPFTRCTVFRCFFRSVVVAKEALQTVPHGMSHGQAREVLGAETAVRRPWVVVRGSGGGGCGWEVGFGVGVAMKSRVVDAGNAGRGICWWAVAG